MTARDYEARQSGAESRTKELLSLVATWRQKTEKWKKTVLSQKGRKKVFQKGNKSAVCCKKGQEEDSQCAMKVIGDLTRAVWGTTVFGMSWEPKKWKQIDYLKAFRIRFWSGGLWMTAEGKWGCFSYFIMGN